MPKLFFVMGMTNAGKSTLIDAVKTIPDLGTVEVGRMMRAKYPPEHFAGQDAPKHTATEAWQMMLDGIDAHRYKKAIFIDGQPRDVEQATRSVALAKFHNWDSEYLILAAPHEVRLARAISRDGKDLPETIRNALISGGPVDLSKVPSALELALKRMTNDYKSNYNVLAELARHGIAPTWIHTDESADYAEIVKQLL